MNIFLVCENKKSQMKKIIRILDVNSSVYVLFITQLRCLITFFATDEHFYYSFQSIIWCFMEFPAD